MLLLLLFVSLLLSLLLPPFEKEVKCIFYFSYLMR